MPATPEQKAEAIRLMRDEAMTPPEVSRLTGIPRRTLADWAKKNGVDTTSPQVSAKTARARAESAASLEVRRLALAGRILEDVEKLRLQLFAPCVERKAMVVHQGKDRPSKVEIVDVEHAQPPFADQQKIMVSIGIGVDKVIVLEGKETAPPEAGDPQLRDELLAAARENGRHLNTAPEPGAAAGSAA